MAQQTALMAPIGPIVRRPQENGYISTDAEAASSLAAGRHRHLGQPHPATRPRLVERRRPAVLQRAVAGA
jgi:hypothetical protein